MLNIFNDQKMQIKTSLRQHYTPTRRRLKTPNVGKDGEQTELLYTVDGSVTGTIALEKHLAVSFKTKLTATLLPSNSTPSIYLQETNTYA